MRWSFVILFFLFGIEFPSEAAKSIPFYDLNGRLACMVPAGVHLQVFSESTVFDNYTHVRLPGTYNQKCGREGLVPAADIKSQASNGPGSNWDLSFLPSPGKVNNKNQAPVEKQIIGEGDVDSDSDDEVTEVTELAGDGNFTLNPSQRGVFLPTRTPPYSSVDNSFLEAGTELTCAECRRNRDQIVDIEELSQQTHQTVSKPMCEARGYEESNRRAPVKGRLREVLADYSERAQGAIRRAFLALVPPKGTQAYEKIKSATRNFQDFNSVDPILLKSLLRKSNRDCYKFVKAALSNDYSVLSNYNHRRSDYRRSPQRRANVELVGAYCGKESGDLTEKHWLNTAVGAGTAGPHLEERGFINLMDNRWGVSQHFRTEASAPEGAVLVYKCASRGRILPSSSCYGDIAIKSKTGYLRDFFTPYSITTSGRRVLVGIYIKPGGPS